MGFLLINSVCSTEASVRIGVAIAYGCEQHCGWDVKFACGYEAYVLAYCRAFGVRIGDSESAKFHGLLARVFGWHGMDVCLRISIKYFLKSAETRSHDIGWLYSLLGYYVGLFILPSYPKELNHAEYPNRDVKATLSERSCPMTVRALKATVTGYLLAMKSDSEFNGRLLHEKEVRYAVD